MLRRGVLVAIALADGLGCAPSEVSAEGAGTLEQPLASQQAKFLPAVPSARDYFGVSTAISGNIALVGQIGPAIDYPGKVFAYERSAGSWSSGQELDSMDHGIGDQLGWSVALSGTTALAGAPEHAQLGASYVFVKSGSSWSQEAKLTAPDANPSQQQGGLDQFGVSVAIDGDTSLVGSRGNDVGTNLDQGAAYVFVRNGTTWTDQQKLVAPDGTASDYFGASVALSGNTALVGAWSADGVGNSVGPGAAYVFVRSGTVWSFQQRLVADDRAMGDSLGQAVALVGNTGLVGAPLDTVGSVPLQGSAYVFERSGTTWTQRTKLLASDGAYNDSFGGGLALSNNRALVGAVRDDDSHEGLGAVYEYLRSGDTWVAGEKLKPEDPANTYSFGAVSLSGNTACIGASGSDGVWGSAYIFVFGDQPAGDPCTSNDECASGHCVDEVCCDDVCDGLCEACSTLAKGSGDDGVCGPVAPGGDPDDDCSAQAPDTCGRTGACDGSWQCQLHAAGISCGTSMCDMSTAKGQICDGDGMCVTSTTGVDCEPYACSSGACRNPCVTTTDCLTGYVCVSGTCRQPGSGGTPCEDGSECTTGHCTDGVCCDDACSGTCVACSAEKKGQGADGECGPIRATQDPESECAAEDESTCGQNGQCNGAGACARWAEGTECGAASCSGATQTAASTCDADGECVTGARTTCVRGYRCDGRTCGTDCDSDSMCATGYVCDTARDTCVSEPDGTAGAGGEGGAPSTGGTAGTATGGAAGTAAGGSPPDTAGEGGEATTPRPRRSASDDDGGCGCRVAGESRSFGASLAGFALLLVFAARRRRSRVLGVIEMTAFSHQAQLGPHDVVLGVQNRGRSRSVNPRLRLLQRPGRRR